jgi:hypothetical protein
MSAALQAIQEGQKLAADLREHEKGTEHQPKQTPEQAFAARVDAALQHERGWEPVLLTRGDQQLGGIIAIGDVNIFHKVVALIDNHCGGHAAPLRGLEPTEEAR